MNDKPIVIGGIGEKKSNSGTQWYFQDRIYKTEIAVSITTCLPPWYLIEENDERQNIPNNKDR